MNKMILKFQNEIARGNLEAVFEGFFQILSECIVVNENSKEEVKELRSNLIMLSGNLFDVRNKFNKGLVSLQEYNLVKNRIRMSLIDILDDIERYAEFFIFLEEKEEEEEWEKATNTNTISSYEEYFRKYPKGKYIEETEKIILELKSELRKKANEEKERRAVLKKHNYLSRKRKGQIDLEDQEAINIVQWWDRLPSGWKKALKDELGVIGEITEKKIKRAMRLKTIDVSNNTNVIDILPIQYITTIRTLNLRGTRIENLNGISNLINLERLNIADTEVNELSPLYGLKNLRSLIYNNLSQSTIMGFRKMCPNCEIKKQN